MSRAVVDPVEAGFDVPAPGKRLTTGRSRTWATKILILFSPLVLIGGLAFLTGVNLGSARVPTPPTIPSSEAALYGLSTFPVDQAAAYGASYLQVCLAHPVGDEEALSRRRSALQAMSSAGVDSSCGWSGEGASQAPVAVVFTGQYTPVPGGTFAEGQAAYLTYTVTLDTGERSALTVPVWVTGAAASPALRVVGPLGVVPLPAGGTPPPPEQIGTPDSALAARVREQVIEPFLIAWAASDAVQLDLSLASDATASARTGLSGIVSEPQVQTVDAFTDKEADAGRVDYTDGDEVRALVTLVWRTAAGAEQQASYQIGLRLVAGKWLVYDIAGGQLDPSGGIPRPDPSSGDGPASTP